MQEWFLQAKDRGFTIPIWKRRWDRFCILNRSGKEVHAYIRGGHAPPKSAEKPFFYVVKPVGETRGLHRLLKAEEDVEAWKITEVIELPEDVDEDPIDKQ
ncbi:hypothetical protein J7L06_00655 [Candidatus Bathyarchaeota archaeon]|nr:hypothetical protein [Candidatus Bathyarchaeota archaeon]